MIRINQFLLFLVFFSLVSCIRNKNVGNETEWVEIEESNYSFTHPKKWSLSKDGLSGTTFRITSPRTSNSDNFQENVNLLIQDLSNHNMNLDEFVNYSFEQIELHVPESKMISCERKVANDLEFQKVIHQGKYNGLDLKFMQYCWVIEEEAYILTFTSEVDCFNSYIRTASRILNSFELKM